MSRRVQQIAFAPSAPGRHPERALDRFPVRDRNTVKGHRRDREPGVRDLSRVIRRDDGADTAAYPGWLIIIAFFGLLGTWSAFAPLNSAVIAQAFVKIDGNRKTIQHLEGGIVSKLLVKEGDTVAVGDTMLVLDATQARSEFDVLDQLAVGLQLTEARLRTEIVGGDDLALPPALIAREREPEVVAAWRGQQGQMQARRRENDGQTEIIRQRIAQLNSQIGGSQAQLDSQRRQRVSMEQELDSLKPLLAQGIVTRPRLLQLERSIAALDGQIGEAGGSVARAEQSIAEQRQLEIQARNQRMTAITQELRDVQMRLAEVLPKLTNVRSIHARTIVRSPYRGRVVGLNVFAVGAVIGRGEKLMDIVPEDERLVLEARIAVEDINEVRPGAAAEVRLTGFKQQTTPALRGQVTSVSADRLTDPRTGAPYYTVNVQIDEAELAALPDIKLYPGMPANAMIPTASRTALQYLTAPLFASFDMALRER